MAAIPETPTLEVLRAAAAHCRACPLWERGTQTVFGEGAAPARVMLVGEQPGDQEDKRRRPFVGPAGRLLDQALVDAGIDRDRAYVTNVVKHFKWVARGPRRIHEKPNAKEIAACRPWLDAEVGVVRPTALICLGATAAQALLGKDFRVSVRHGEILKGTGIAELVMATVHPSSLLRAPDEETRRAGLLQFVEDLKGMAKALAKLG